MEFQPTFIKIGPFLTALIPSQKLFVGPRVKLMSVNVLTNIARQMFVHAVDWMKRWGDVQRTDI